MFDRALDDHYKGYGGISLIWPGRYRQLDINIHTESDLFIHGCLHLRSRDLGDGCVTVR